MFGARAGEPELVTMAIVAAWKLNEYGEFPSADTFFWTHYGYTYYQDYNQDQIEEQWK
jgi:hypothetical protein